MEGASGYEVQIGANAAPTDDDETIARTADETSYRSEGLESGTPYYFRVRSLTGNGEDRLFSDWSAPATAQIGRIEQSVSLGTEETSDTDLSDLPPEVAAKLEAFLRVREYGRLLQPRSTGYAGRSVHDRLPYARVAGEPACGVARGKF